MKQLTVIVLLVLFSQTVTAQTVAQQLAQAMKAFEADPQMKYAIASLYVMDAKTGKPVYAHNERIGLAPASTQKLFTSAAALELLGKDYTYKTRLAYSGNIDASGVLDGALYVIGSGDPTLGSWRWGTTKDTVILNDWLTAVKKKGITRITGYVTTHEAAFSHQAIPDGWIWQDIGNYYGAGAYSLNWKENQYDIFLQSGNRPGDSVQVVEWKASDVVQDYVNELKTAPKGTGDNAYIYLYTGPDRNMLLKGTIPAGEKRFSISGASADPVSELLYDFAWYLEAHSIQSWPSCTKGRDMYHRGKETLKSLHYFHTTVSPTLDSINYWFLRRSVNLYGEAFVRTIAFEKEGYSDMSKGVELVRDFWQERGIDKAAIHIIDGSGLSPQNRVTTEAEVKVLQYAKTRPWFQSFYNALPEYNGMKMKSGSIGGARAYAGYHKAKDGKEYIFSMIVNNYDGSAGQVLRKMYRVLDILK